MDPVSRSRLYEIAREIEDLATRSQIDTGSRAGGGGGGDANPEFFKALVSVHQMTESVEVAQMMCRLAVNFLDGEKAFSMLVTGEQKLRFAAGENVTAAELAGGFPVARHLIQQALASAEIVADEHEGRSVICVPILAFPPDDQPDAPPVKLGLLYLDRGHNLEVTDLVLEQLEAIVDHSATALMNLRRVSSGDGPAINPAKMQELERKSTELERLKANVGKLYEVGREIASTLELNDLLIKIVDYVVELAEAQRGFIMLVEGREPVYKVGRTSRKHTIPLEHFQFSRSVTHRTITEKKPQFLVCSNEEGDAEFNPSRSMVAMELKSVMCVPLMEKDNVLGLIYLDSQQQSKEFSPADAELLQSLCGQAAVALLNAKLYKEVTENERMNSELKLASQIQLGLLPKADPEVNGLEIRGSMIPAKEVGGDYFDFIPHKDTRDSLTVAIGDVSGKGVGAGLVMIMARSIIRSAVNQEGIPQSTTTIMKNINSLFCQDLRKGMFMTLNIVNWWSQSNTLSYTSAGHEHVIIYRAATGQVECFRAGGVATGVLERANAMYKEQSFQLAEGDQVLLYTDGVTEAMDVENEEWGMERLQAAVARHGDRPPLDLINAINQEIKEFVGQAEQHDDITMVAMKAKPTLFAGDVSGEMENLLDMFGD